MTPATHDWLAGLRAAAVERQAATSRTPPDNLAAVAAERLILAAHLATWLDAVPTLLDARRALARSVGPAADPEAAIVLTTSPAGVEVALGILARDEPLARHVAPRIACVTEKDYRAWCMTHPDHGHHLHVNHWSWIKTRLPARRVAEFARHPLREGERLWLHRTGTTGAGTADGRAAHLWKFTGVHAVLLEPFVVEHRAAPPGA